MALLWIRDVSEQWTVIPLEGEAFTLTVDPLQPVRVRRGEDESNGSAVILRRQAPDGESWVLMTTMKTGVRVNGTPLPTGIRVLRDRDELRVDSMDHIFFSTESLARATAEEREGRTAVRFEVVFASLPCAAELAHALSALSVACRLCGCEAKVLQQDEVVAREYLELRRTD